MKQKANAFSDVDADDLAIWKWSILRIAHDTKTAVKVKDLDKDAELDGWRRIRRVIACLIDISANSSSRYWCCGHVENYSTTTFGRISNNVGLGLVAVAKGSLKRQYRPLSIINNTSLTPLDPPSPCIRSSMTAHVSVVTNESPASTLHAKV
ncbi:hypothetical protein BGZ83_007627 [Gryganskiella cystojenkinii]|nr:hypothetical protein BGZ83_007627 [Gryganskiella cystojenkinii]